jgi:predicted nuclease of predicted toxin-antitoxin system
MKFLANENFPLVSVRLLRDAGYDLASILEDNPGTKDYQVLKRAQVEGRIILTFDRDYGELIYRYKSVIPAGIVFFRFDPYSPAEPAEILLKILRKNEAALPGKLTVVERDRIRQRLLPERL